MSGEKCVLKVLAFSTHLAFIIKFYIQLSGIAYKNMLEKGG